MADTIYSEDKVTALLSAISGEMLLVNRDAVIQYAESADSVLNASFTNAEGAYLWDVFTQDIAQKLMQAMSAVFLHNSRQELTVQIIEGDQSTTRKVKVVRCGEWEAAILFMTDESPVSDSVKDRELELKHIQQKMITKNALIPMCSSCKEIRDKDGFWVKLEVYLHRHANIDITHTMCPTCQEEWYK
ncbi:MAG: hypothetical protein AAFP70_11640 [Calditrichota bacterium]